MSAAQEIWDLGGGGLTFLYPKFLASKFVDLFNIVDVADKKSKPRGRKKFQVSKSPWQHRVACIP